MNTGFVYLRPITAVAVRVAGPYRASSQKAWEIMFDWVRTSGPMRQIIPSYGLLLDDPSVTAPEDCRYEACIALEPKEVSPLPPGFKVKQIPGGPFERARHVGTKVGIARTISSLRSEWMSKDGLVIDTLRPMIEIYLDTPFRVPVGQQRVDVCLPVMVQCDENQSAA